MTPTALQHLSGLTQRRKGAKKALSNRLCAFAPLREVLCFSLLLVNSISAAETPLTDAAERDDIAAIGKLLDQKADANAMQVDGMTALHWAVYHDNLDVAKRLVDAGAEVKTAS